MSEAVIEHWERVILKNLRSKDRTDTGNLVSESGKHLP